MRNSNLPLNLLIADDHQLITEGLSKMLQSEKEVGEIYIARNGQEAVDEAFSKDVDCVVMDINMPVLNGLEATKEIKRKNPEIKIIIVSMLSDASIVSKLMKAGADAFIGKETGKSELLLALKKIMLGEKYISPKISNNLILHLTDRTVNKINQSKNLTLRELEILRYIAEGLTNQEIAEKLFLSTATVDTHRKNMLAKLQVKNTASLVKYAADNNLL